MTTMIKHPRTVITRFQQRLTASPGAPTTPSEIALRPFPNPRSTPRW